MRVTLIATGFSGGNDGKAAFFSSEAATQAAADNVKRRAETPVQEMNPVDAISRQTVQQNSSNIFGASTQHASTAPLSGNVSVDEDKNIPPFLRKMKG